MKRKISLLLTLALALCGAAALAEGAPINCFIEDGSYIIQIPDPESDLGWVADDMAQDDSVVVLYDADLIEDTFVVRYDPVGDGEVTVGVRHYTGIACDKVHTWDLRVQDGAIQEAVAGSYTEAPDEVDLTPWLLGNWLEQDTQFTQMSVEKNPERGWDVEIASPLTHGAYIFKTTVYYDCELDAFVYDKGKFWDVPITDSEKEADLGEAKISGSTGSFTFGGTTEAPTLTWYNDVTPEEQVVFERQAIDVSSGAVTPMPRDVDLSAIEDGIYPVAFDRDALVDGALTLDVFTEDVYDIVDIDTLAVGDTIVIDGEAVEVTSLERRDDLLINGGLEEGGYDLRAYDESNGYMVAQYDDYPTWTEHGEVTLPLSDDVVFTDAWDIESEPVTANGVGAVAQAIAESGNDRFIPHSTTVRVENGAIVEINRRYMP